MNNQLKSNFRMPLTKTTALHKKGSASHRRMVIAQLAFSSKVTERHAFIAEFRAKLEPTRAAQMKSAKILLDNPKAKIQHRKDGSLYVNPRNEKGHCLGAINL